MRFEKIQPSPKLRPYVQQLVISVNDTAAEYKVFPTTGMVVGFQYKGSLKRIDNTTEQKLSTAGITGITDSYKAFSNTACTASILVYFTTTGLSHFTTCPANELFNQSISLQEVFDKSCTSEAEEKLSLATSDAQRIRIVERFLLSQLKNIDRDKMVIEAVRRIYQQKGNVRIKQLSTELYISQSPFEKRFRKIVGTSPKKFADIVRFNTVLHDLNTPRSLLDICYDHHFFDQAHFINDFKKYTGSTPEELRP